MNDEGLADGGGGLAAHLTAGGASAQRTWTNTLGGVWGVAENWNPNGTPGAEVAYLTNGMASYVVSYNTQDTAFQGTSAFLVMTNASPGETVTLEVNAKMGGEPVTSSAYRFRLRLYHSGYIVVNNGGQINYTVPSGHIMTGNIRCKSGGIVNIADDGGRLSGVVHLESGGSFFSSNPIDLTGGARVTIEPNALWNHGGLVNLDIGRDINSANTTTIVTNRGTFTSGPNVRVGRDMNASTAHAQFWQEAGSFTISVASSFLAIGYASFNNSPGVALFDVSGGTVGNVGSLYVGINENTTSGQRTTDGRLVMRAGTWNNTGSQVVIGGFRTGYTGTAGANASNYSILKGSMTQTGGVFRSLGNVYVANGPSEGSLSISGGSFTVTNSGGNATLFVGSKEGANVGLVGHGQLSLSGGSLRADRLTATNGAAFSQIDFAGGVLETAGSAVDNGSAFEVGDGTRAATLRLLGGSHAFADGLTVSDQGLLTGEGTVTAPALTLASGASLAVGSSAGTMSVTGDVSFAAGSVWTVDLNGTSPGDEYDELVVDGTVDLGGATLDLQLGFAPVLNQTFVILRNDSAQPTQGAFAEGGGVTAEYNGRRYYFRISTEEGDDGNDVVLTAGAIGTLIMLR